MSRFMPMSLLVMGAATVLISTGAAPQTLAATVSTQKAVRSTVVQYVSLAGTVASRSQVAVSYLGQSTTVSQISVKVGQVVKKGQKLAALANGQTLTSPLQGTVVSINLTAGDLVPGSSSSSSASSTSSISPSQFGGRGGFSSPAESVSTSTVSTPLSITVADTKHVTVNASASELAVGRIRAGQAVTIDIPGEPGVQYQGRVEEVSMSAASSASAASASYPVVISFDGVSAKPVPLLGMSADLSVATADQRGTAVPIAAVHQTASGKDVVELANGQQRTVHLGIIGLNTVIVASGLSVGESVRVPKASLAGALHQVTVEVLPSFSGRFSGGFGGF